MRSILLTGFSFLLTAAVIANGYYQKHQFYPSVVYITKSNASMAVLYIQALVLIILMGKFMRKVFFGQLRAAEMEHLIERSWYAVTETCLAFTVFRDDFSPRFVASFTFLLFLKSFHWLAEDRVDYMERSPVISYVFHTRVISLLLFLGSFDVYFMSHAYHSTIMKGASVQLVFGFEYAILATVVVMTLLKYIMHTIDIQNENPWENKAVYLLYTELLIGGVKVLLYVAFMMIMIRVHTFPLFAIRPMYITLRAFKKALHDVIMSRRAIRNMNTLYPDATVEEIQAGDNVCIICREEMTTGCKKLPCNHIYHTSCLRSWFQRQQTCPTCRMDVLRVPRADHPAAPPPQQQQQQQPQPPPQQPIPPQIPPYMMPGFPVWPPPAFQQGPANVPVTSAAAPTPVPPTSTDLPPHPQFSPSPPFLMPQMPFDFPRPPPDLNQLAAEELSALEGLERRNVEMRIEWLRDIQTLLDAAMMMVNQYNDVANALSMPNISASNVAPTDTAPTSTGGARPKSYTFPPPTQTPRPASTPQDTPTSLDSPPPTASNSNDYTAGDTDGACGYTSPTTTDEKIPEMKDTDDSMHEVRRRRLEKFASLDDQKSSGNNSVEDATSAVNG